MTTDRVPDLDELEELWLRCLELVDEPGQIAGHSAAYYQTQSRAMSAAFEALPALIRRVREAEQVLRETRQMLRLECGEVDANDWPDNLHPADVIEKHLVRAWQTRLARLERVRKAAQAYSEGRAALSWQEGEPAPWELAWQDLRVALAALEEPVKL